MMQKNIGIIIIMSSAAIVTSITIFPRHQDINYLRLMDGDYQRAQIAYSHHLSQGDWSHDTVIPLIKAYQQSGNFHAAIDLAEQLNTRQPNQIEVLMLLNQLYQRTNRYANYLDTLAQITDINPQPQRLRQLAQAYAYRGQINQQIATLEKLRRHHVAKFADRLTLALLYASQSQSFAQLGSLLKPTDATQHPLPIKSQLILIRYFLDQQKNEVVTQMIETWLSQTTSLTLVTELGYWLINHDLVKLINPSVLTTLRPFAQKNASLARLLLDIEMTNENHASALARLHQWQLTGKLPHALYALYFELAMTENNSTSNDIATHVTQLVKDDSTLEQYYINALQSTKNTNQLTHYLLDKLQHTSLSQTHESLLISTLISEKKYQSVLPLLQQRAFDDREYWLYTYVKIAKKLHKTEQALDYIWTHYQTGTTTTQQQRQMAHLLLEAGQKKRAEFLFRLVAQQADFNSPDVQQLFFLWGPRPDHPSIKWIANRASSTRNKQQVLWIKKLIQLDATHHAFHILKETDQLKHAVAQRLWVDAIITTKNIDPASSHIRYAMEYFTDLKALRRLAYFVDNQQNSTITKAIWDKILTVDTNDPEALRYLGRLAYRHSLWQTAVNHLQRYLEHNTQQNTHTMEDHYYLADALRLTDHPADSINYYQASLQLIDNHPSASSRIMSLKPIILARLGQLDASVAAFEQLYNTQTNNGNPNKKLVANYASILLEQGNHAKAQYVLQYQ